MTQGTRLSHTEILSDRAFTHPEHNAADSGILALMADRLRQLLLQPHAIPDLPHPFLRVIHEPDGRFHRIVIANHDGLRAGEDAAVVGFFGHRRPDPDPDTLRDKDVVDVELINEFPNYPEVLSYSSMELDAGNFGNLVLLRRPDVAEHWQTNARHAYASRIIAPRYYFNIRLHNGVLPGGPLSGHHPILIRTKYYDFEGDFAWHAVREFPSPYSPPQD